MLLAMLRHVSDTAIRKKIDEVLALRSFMPEYESSSVNKSGKKPLKQRPALCLNEYQKRMVHRKHPRTKFTALLVYLSVRTALPLRCVFFDALSA